MMLTDDENKVLDHLRDAWHGFIRLPVEHPQATQEFLYKMNDLQRMITARSAARDEGFVAYRVEIGAIPPPPTPPQTGTEPTMRRVIRDLPPPLDKRMSDFSHFAWGMAAGSAIYLVISIAEAIIQ